MRATHGEEYVTKKVNDSVAKLISVQQKGRAKFIAHLETKIPRNPGPDATEDEIITYKEQVETFKTWLILAQEILQKSDQFMIDTLNRIARFYEAKVDEINKGEKIV